MTEAGGYRTVGGMNTLTPAQNEKERIARKESVELCGKNRGPHQYVPIEWLKTETSERVTRFMCTICFTHVATKTLIINYPEATL